MTSDKKSSQSVYNISHVLLLHSFITLQARDQSSMCDSSFSEVSSRDSHLKMKNVDFETKSCDENEVDCCGITSDYGQSYLEKNCNQIFVKGPALTKEILEKMNTDLVPKETHLFGYDFNTKKVLCKSLWCELFTSPRNQPSTVSLFRPFH